MKNITVSVDEDVYRAARIKAAERDTSVSSLVKEFLISLSQKSAEFERLKSEEAALRSTLLKKRKGLVFSENLSRDQLHERDALR